jgi:hypothetical protein
MKKTLFGFLMVGLAFIALQVETAEAQIGIGHPCYDIDPSNGGRDGHACWPKSEHLSEDEVKLTSRNAELEYELSAARDALAIAMGEIRSLKQRMSDNTPTRHSKMLQGNSHEGDADDDEASPRESLSHYKLCNMLHHMVKNGVDFRAEVLRTYAREIQRCSINIPWHQKYGRECDYHLQMLRPAECKEYYKIP